jgi:tetratricopeptide (TPR) repeat protein
MKRRLGFALPVILLASAVQAEGLSNAALPDILARVHEAVVTIVTYDSGDKPLSQGSGFIATPDGLVVTCWHVVAGASKIKVVRRGGAEWTAQGIVAADAERDFAIVKVAGKNLPTIPLGDSDKVRQGDRVVAISSPLGLDQTASEGIISSVRALPDGQKVLQTTAAVSEGSSGGPVLDGQGRVVAIAAFVIAGGQSLNFAVPVNAIKARLAGARTAAPLPKAPRPSDQATADALFWRGVLAMPEGINAPDAAKKFEGALAIFREVVEKWPRHAGGHFLAGYCLGGLGRHTGAIESYKRAIKIKPDFAGAHYALGIEYGQLGRQTEAIESYKQAIKIDPEFADAHVNVGVAYGELGRYSEAIESYKQAIRIKPDLAKAHYDLGVAYAQLGRQTEAIESFKQAVRIKPDYAEAHCGLGVDYMSLGRYGEAIESCKEAVKINPDLAGAHFTLGATYLLTGDKGRALDEYKVLKGMNPEMAGKLFDLIYR